MARNPRDATSSAKGYDYQLCYLMRLIAIHYKDDEYSFQYEGEEDIDIYSDDKLITPIQVKYHSTPNSKNPNEKLDKDGGLTKVFKIFAILCEITF